MLMPAMVVEEVVAKHCGNAAGTERLQYGSGKGASERQVERWSTIKQRRREGGVRRGGRREGGVRGGVEERAVCGGG